jgi:hypothetical protein
MKKFSKLSIPLFLIFIAARLFGQSVPPQNGIKLFFEKVFVHTDRAIYAAGEDIWFKTYITNAQDNHLIGTSKNLYVELIAPDNSIVNKEIINIAKGTGKGDFALADDIVPGNYRLRAYTNWQRNFGDNFIFEKAITVTAGESTTKSIAKAGIKTADKNIQQGNNTGLPVIRFFPEGGSLVSEVNAFVAVKAEDASGKGISVTGPILSASGDTVARFSCDSLGMGLFAIVPLAGQNYHTSVKYMGQTITAQLPAPLSSGLCLKAQKRDTLIYVTISCNNAAAANYAGKTLSLSVKHAGTAYIDQPIHLTDNQALLKIPASILPEGIAALTLYDDQHKPNCERLVYIEHPARQTKLNITTQKPVYKSREQVTVNIKATEGGKPVSGNFSLAAVDAGLNPPDASNITAYLLLQSDIKGQIEHAAKYFDTTNVNRARQLDMLLLTQGWRDFVWRRLADTAIKISYLPEQGFTISGMVATNESGKTGIPNANITLQLPKAVGQKMFFGKADATGKYYFDNLPLTGEQNVKLTTRDDKGNPNGLILVDSIFKNGLPVNHKNLVYNKISPELTTEIGKRVASVKTLDSITTLKEVKVQGTNTVALADQTAVTSGYKDEVLTVTPKDLSFNRLKDYILYKSQQAKPDPTNNDQIVFFADGKTYSPRIVVDNREQVFTDDDDVVLTSAYYSLYYNLPMTSVEKVVIKRLLAGLKAPTIKRTQIANPMGNSLAGSRIAGPENLFVIYLTLKPGAMFKNGRGITATNVQGYYEERSFYKPIHGGGGYDSQKPDLRNTIHWAPEVKTDSGGQATISFYNADPKSNIRITVQGVTDAGEPVSASKVYSVK